MYGNSSWLDKLERKFGWFALPNLALYLVILQVFGYIVYLLSANNPEMILKIFLIPELVLKGEIWRLITFMAIPMHTNIFIMLIALTFLYFVLSSLEAHWGEFKTTFYLAIAVFLSIAFSFIAHYPITSFLPIELSLFFAMATLFPEYEVRLYMILPVKMKWIALLSAAFLLFSFIIADLHYKIYTILVYTNYMLFFGPQLYTNIKLKLRRNRFK